MSTGVTHFSIWGFTRFGQLKTAGGCHYWAEPEDKILHGCDILTNLSSHKAREVSAVAGGKEAQVTSRARKAESHANSPEKQLIKCLVLLQTHVSFQGAATDNRRADHQHDATSGKCKILGRST